MSARTILVTGASGFVGRELCRTCEAAGHRIICVDQQPQVDDGAQREPRENEWHRIEISGQTDWSSVLKGADAVIHLAAKVHAREERTTEAAREYDEVNHRGAARLAEAAAEAGVGRVVLVSTVKVNGESTRRRPFSEADPPNPSGPYAVSKRRAEESVREVAQRAGMEAVIVRSPLVYGPRVRANFLRLLRLVAGGIPLPLGLVDNRRSLVGVGNLAHFLLRSATHPAAGGETFLVSDGEDLSTRELVSRMARLLGRRFPLFPCPVPLLRLAAVVVNQRDAFERVCGSLQVDIRKARERLSWSPPFSVDDELERTVNWYSGQRPAGDTA